MKRAGGPNLVYPFETKRVNLMPPFFSPNGFAETTEGQSTVLSLDIDRPLTFSTRGQLALKLGNGLHVTSKGALEVDSNKDDIATADPLTNSNGQIGLKTGPGMQVAQGALRVATAPPLIVDDSGNTTLATDGTLKISGQNLSVKTVSPLTSTSGGIGLNVGKGLVLDSGFLTTIPVQGSGAIEVFDRIVRLKTTSTFKQTGEALSLSVTAPLSTSTNGLSLGLSNEFGTDAQGRLFLNYGRGIGKDDKGVLYVGLERPLVVNKDGNISLPLGSGLSSATGQLAVSFGPGLMASSGDANTPNSVQIKAGNGLALNSENALQAKVGRGIFFDSNGAIAVNFGGSVKSIAPIEVKEDTVGLTYGSGLEVNENGSLQLKLGRGFQISEDGSLQLNLGRGLSLTAENKLMSYPVSLTLWTTPDPGGNIKNGTGMMRLVLTKAGSAVIGKAQLTGTGAGKNVVNNSTYTATLQFDKNGDLLRDISTLTGPWGFRGTGDLAQRIDTEAPFDKRLLMPNTVLYPVNATPDGPGVFVEDVTLRPGTTASDRFTDTVRSVVTINAVNQDSPAKFALTFKWGPFPNRNYALITSPTTFTYVTLY